MSAGTRERAADVLGLSAGAEAAEAAAAFLAGLPAAGFVPTDARVAALNSLAGTNAPEDGGSGLAAEIEEFARRFWSLAPVERGAVWARLARRAEDSPFAGRLLDLRPGLEVPTEPASDPTAEEVAALVRELFVLPPGGRAVRRNEWLLANADRHHEFVRGAAALARQQPALAALDPVLAIRLTRAFDAAEFTGAAKAEPLHEPLPVLRREAAPVEVIDRWEARDNRNAGRILAAGCLLLVLPFVVAGVRGGLSLLLPEKPPASRPPAPRPPDINRLIDEHFAPTPPQGLTPGSGPQVTFTAAQVAAFREYAATVRGERPPGFDDWVNRGMPEAGAAASVQPVIPVRGGGLYFSPGVVAACQRFESAGGTGARPPLYDLWVQAGRPEASTTSPFGTKAKP